MRKTNNTTPLTAKPAALLPRRGKNPLRLALAALIVLVLALGAALGFDLGGTGQSALSPALQESVDQAIEQHEVAPVQGNAELSNNGVYYIYDDAPDFGSLSGTATSFEYYSPLDRLSRCGTAIACLGRDLMPTESRQSIAEVKPTGWHSDRYDFIDGGNLYNRSHLIAFSLTGENANDQNLITGTRQLNLAMSDFEIEIANYIRATGNHVLYRVTPVFVGSELVARGVQLEALSVEDGGTGICINIFIPNVQSGVGIDYASGDNWLATTSDPITDASSTADITSVASETDASYVINRSSKKFHFPWCDGAATMSAKNRQETDLSRDELIAQGYSPCGSCKP